MSQPNQSFSSASPSSSPADQAGAENKPKLKLAPKTPSQRSPGVSLENSEATEKCLAQIYEEKQPLHSLKDKTLFITGASRGIGLAIALRAARDGANIAIVAKTTLPAKNLPGTIYTAAEEIIAAGGRALPIECDVRSEEQVKRAVEICVSHFGGIDILINNASAIRLSNVEHITMKEFDLMHQINARGTFLCSKYCLPHLKKSSCGKILMMSPPLSMRPRWFESSTAYAMAKYGMSLVVLGLAEELREYKIAVNALWPRSSIATAAVQNVLGGEAMMERSRTAEIMSDAAYVILTASHEVTGGFLIDEDVLRQRGVTDEELLKYAFVKGTKNEDLVPDFFLDYESRL